MDMAAIIPTFASALAVALVLGWFKVKVAAYDPAGISSKTGTISPHKGLILFVIIMGIIFFSFGLFGAIYIDEMIVHGSACALMGAAFVILSLPSLTAIHDIHWNDVSLNGPAKVKFQLMGLSRQKLNWSELVEGGLVKGGYYYVENNAQERIYWSRAYKGYEHFEASLAENCPDIVLPAYEIHPK